MTMSVGINVPTNVHVAGSITRCIIERCSSHYAGCSLQSHHPRGHCISPNSVFILTLGSKRRSVYLIPPTTCGYTDILQIAMQDDRGGNLRTKQHQVYSTCI